MLCAYSGVNFPLRLSCSTQVLLSLIAATAFPCLQAEDAPKAPPTGKATPQAEKKKIEKPGDWVVLPSDGTPWKHELTDLRYPQSMGGFHLRLGFQDKNEEGGVAISYTHEKKNIRGDVVLFPCKTDLNKVTDIMAYLRGEHDKVVKDLVKASTAQGYKEVKRMPIEERGIKLWEGNIPLTVQNFEYASATPNDDESVRPPTSQWLGLTVYQDYFVQMSIVRPTSSAKEGEEFRDELVKLFLQCVREPSVLPQMLKLCRTYVENPLTPEGRKAADALADYSQASPIFKIIYPGEVLTPALDAANAVDKEMALDLLRGFSVGSAVVALQGGTADQSIEEGVKIMAHVYDELKKKNDKVKSDLMEELIPLVAKERAASFLRQKMSPTAEAPATSPQTPPPAAK